MSNTIREASEFLFKRTQTHAETAIILGTGLNGLAGHVNTYDSVPYGEIPHFAVSTVQGHAGNLIFGHIGTKEVIVMQGRLHYYEGYSMQQVTFPIRVMKELGVKTLILSNAAGGVNPQFHIGDIMLIRDHINFFPEHPLHGKNDDTLGPRFPNMSEVYDGDLIEKAEQIGRQLGIPYQKGVYAGVQGPSLETPAEYRMYRILGADSVGMSTVPEAIVAHHASMRCMGFSVITNVYSEGQKNQDSHEAILQAGARAEHQLIEWVSGLLPLI